MSESKGNEPAFPRTYNDSDFSATDVGGHNGLTKREFAAIAIMSGWAAGRNNGDVWNNTASSDPKHVAESCVAYADALLAELEKK